MTDFVKVVATVLTSRNGLVLGFQYVARRADGSGEIIRKKATRLYANAFEFDGHINFAVKDGSVAGTFALGKAAPRHARLNVIATHPIETDFAQ